MTNIRAYKLEKITLFKVVTKIQSNIKAYTYARIRKVQLSFKNGVVTKI